LNGEKDEIKKEIVIVHQDELYCVGTAATSLQGTLTCCNQIDNQWAKPILTVIITTDKRKKEGESMATMQLIC
jgi:hypothetical protein